MDSALTPTRDAPNLFWVNKFINRQVQIHVLDTFPMVLKLKAFLFKKFGVSLISKDPSSPLPPKNKENHTLYKLRTVSWVSCWGLKLESSYNITHVMVQMVCNTHERRAMKAHGGPGSQTPPEVKMLVEWLRLWHSARGTYTVRMPCVCLQCHMWIPT